MRATDPYIVASWRDEDLAPLRAWRKQKARIGQDADSSKEERRDAKRSEKAATPILHMIEGTGPCAIPAGAISIQHPANYFPAELDMHLSIASSYLGAVEQSHRA